ncbi:MAG: hypothetical protein R3330_05760, partial [Saprospiraceae bacterium]|nr:hypothetical protein [Saprospiraceae bacterium]
MRSLSSYEILFLHAFDWQICVVTRDIVTANVVPSPAVDEHRYLAGSNNQVRIRLRQEDILLFLPRFFEMQQEISVYKFGGASVKDAEAVRNMAAIVGDHCSAPGVIVVSAMGKMTNALESLAEAFHQKTGEVPELFEVVRSFHWEVASALF